MHVLTSHHPKHIQYIAVIAMQAYSFISYKGPVYMHVLYYTYNYEFLIRAGFGVIYACALISWTSSVKSSRGTHYNTVYMCHETNVLRISGMTTNLCKFISYTFLIYIRISHTNTGIHDLVFTLRTLLAQEIGDRCQMSQDYQMLGPIQGLHEWLINQIWSMMMFIYTQTEGAHRSVGKNTSGCVGVGVCKTHYNTKVPVSLD